MTKQHAGMAMAVALALMVHGCDSATGPEESWPADLDAVFSTVFFDGVGDQEAIPAEREGPPYSGPVPFPSVDVTRVAMGVEGDFLYLRVDFTRSS